MIANNDASIDNYRVKATSGYYKYNINITAKHRLKSNVQQFTHYVQERFIKKLSDCNK